MEGCNIIGLILLTTIASLIFTIIMYTLGYYGGGKLIEKLSRKSKKMQNKMKKGAKKFSKYRGISLLVARFIPFSRTYVSILAGVYKQDFTTYLICSFFGLALWNTIFVMLGVSLFFNIDYLVSFYQNYKRLILIGLNVIIVILFMGIINKKKR